MHISTKYIIVEKLEEEAKEGFQTVQVQDNFVYKGKVIQVPEQPAFIDNHQLESGDVVLFAKYSPDTHEIEHEDKKIKFIRVEDVLACI